jgi:hypothetical protein
MPYRSTAGVGPDATFGDSCVPVDDCSCGADFCRKVGAYGICEDVIG